MKPREENIKTPVTSSVMSGSFYIFSISLQTHNWRLGKFISVYLDQRDLKIPKKILPGFIKFSKLEIEFGIINESWKESQGMVAR